MSNENQQPFSRGDGTRTIGDDRGIFYFRCLQALFTNGVEDFGRDTANRADFVSENQHLFAGTVLCSMFAYLESTLGHKSRGGTTWIDRHGGRTIRELQCLRIVRNAFVHSNSHIDDLASVTDEEKNELRSFIRDLEAGNIKDDKGNTYPVYISLSDDDVVSLNEQAIFIFVSIGRTLSH